MLNVDQAAVSKARKKLSDQQGSREKTIHKCCTEYAQIDRVSIGLLFLWTGRCSPSKSLFQIYGRIPETFNISEIFQSKLRELLQRIFRYFHPGQANQPGDEAAVRLVETGVAGDGDESFSDDSFRSFCEFVEDKQYFGRMPVMRLLLEAHCEWHKQLKGKTGQSSGKENVCPHMAAPAAPHMAAPAAAHMAAPHMAGPHMAAPVAPQMAEPPATAPPAAPLATVPHMAAPAAAPQMAAPAAATPFVAPVHEAFAAAIAPSLAGPRDHRQTRPGGVRQKRARCEQPRLSTAMAGMWFHTGVMILHTFHTSSSYHPYRP